MRCPACSNDQSNRHFEAREMQFGTREAFEYGECSRCGCLWLLRPPGDLSRYYGPGYFSLRRSRLRSWVRQRPNLYRLANLVRNRRLPPGLPEWWPQPQTRFDATVLDVGSGVGNLLLHLKFLGFKHLTGIDPYLGSDIHYRGGPTVFKRSIADVMEQFEIVVLNHSFEHMADPRDVFRHLRRVLANDGKAVIRTPVASSFAYRKYGPNWVQLDAPRHLVVHTVRSITALAAESGLEVLSIVHDSTGFQFWGSEQYLRDIPLTAPESHQMSPRHSTTFAKSELRRFEALARKLNAAGEGDQVSVVLSRTSPRTHRRDG